LLIEGEVRGNLSIEEEMKQKKVLSFSVLFFGAKKRTKRNIHPLPSSPYMGRLN
jgi:hypothetical protein